MRVRWDSDACFELPQHDDSARVRVLVENHQLDAFIRTRLPGLVLREGDVGEHGGSEFLDVDVAEPHLEGFLALADAVNLQPEET